MQINGKLSHEVELKELMLLKWPCYPKQYSYSIQCLSKYPWFFTRTRINNPKFHMEFWKAPNCSSNLKKINKAGGVTLSDFRLFYKTTIIKTMWF